MALTIPLATGALLCAGCTSPFSDFQSARVMAKGETEVTGHYSVVSFAAGGGDRERIQDSFGLNAAVGIDGDAEFRLRYERIELAESADGINVLGAGPKFVVSPEHVAFFLPFGFAFGEDIQTSDTWETHPTFLFSGSPVPWVEITGSAKALLRLREPVSGPRLAFNVGLAIGPDPSAFAIRPEVGFMVNTGGEGHYRHLGVGVSVGFGEPRSARGMEGAFAYEGIDFRGRGGMVEVTGRIVNRSGRDYAAVTFLVTAQDTLGRVLASDYLYLSDFKSGETRRFNTFIVQVDYAGVAECGLRFDSAQRAKSIGARARVRADEEDVVERIHDVTGRGADVSLDALGSAATSANSILNPR